MTVVSSRLAGKCAYITGAAGGLGRAIARRMVEQGARVFVTDIAEAAVLDAFAQELNAGHATPVAFAATQDVRDEARWQALLAQAVDLDPTTVNYVAYDGGGELLAGILGSQIAFGASGIGEVAEQAASGDVRILAVTTAEPVEGIDAPTLTEEGVDLVFTNWRGIVAPPGLSEEQTQAFIDAVTAMRDSEGWQQALEDNGWTDAFITGDEYADFLTSESDRVAGVLGELGLA